jgi:transcriptional regulator with XRE-family HTH domain
VSVATSIGPRVKAARREQGWTQEMLGDRLGKPRGWVAKLETGRLKTVTVDLLIELATFLNTDASRLVPELIDVLPNLHGFRRLELAVDSMVQLGAAALKP